MTGERVVTDIPPMVGQIVAEVAALAVSQGWDLVGMFTDNDGTKTIAIRDASGAGVQITIVPGKVAPRT